MSRVFTIAVILLLMAVVALVPRIGTDEPGAVLGDGYAYREDTLARFRLLLEDEAWTLADPPRNAQGMLEAVHERTGLTFVLVPAGRFLMGSPEDEEGRFDDEGPVHAVRVPAFLMCRTECPQRVWEKGGGKNYSDFKGADRPVDGVSWTGCHDWCAQNGLRLPSEAEWEYACRAGSTTRFSFGDDEELLRHYAVGFDEEGAGSGTYAPATTDPPHSFGLHLYGGTQATATKRPNSFGLHDMHSNVWEWCEDDWHASYDGAPADGSAWKTGGAKLQVYRGGDSASYADFCRSACRCWFFLDYRYIWLGFRPAADLPRVAIPTP